MLRFWHSNTKVDPCRRKWAQLEATQGGQVWIKTAKMALLCLTFVAFYRSLLAIYLRTTPGHPGFQSSATYAWKKTCFGPGTYYQHHQTELQLKVLRQSSISTECQAQKTSGFAGCQLIVGQKSVHNAKKLVLGEIFSLILAQWVTVVSSNLFVYLRR